MPGGVGQRAGLAPAGDAAIDQRRLALQADVRPQAERLHDAGAKALDQHVGLRDQPQRDLAGLRLLEVQRDRLAPARQHIAVARGEGSHAVALARLGGLDRAVDADDARALVGQHHAGKGRWPQPGELDHREVRQGAGALLHVLPHALTTRPVLPSVLFVTRKASFRSMPSPGPSLG